jgi:hypothetical protein
MKTQDNQASHEDCKTKHYGYEDLILLENEEDSEQKVDLKEPEFSMSSCHAGQCYG